MSTLKTKKKFLNVSPKSQEAKDIFKYDMNSLHAVRIKEETDTKYFVSSISGHYDFWLNKNEDYNWNQI